MENFYIVILCFLAVLAAFDLFVGVSNDAVNFLNSAIGSRITTFRVIMVVASVGVLAGATFSSGMMEVARSGIFNPQMFSFHDIMWVFLAVMVTDIILLDIFNTFGLPTSTTVSIVFELLGAALAVAAYKLFTAGNTVNSVMNYINSSKSLAIISGILISVIVAFIVGAISQYLIRLVFTFHIEKAYARFGAIFGSMCLTSIVYFLVMKGAKGASFMRPEWLMWLKTHTGIIVLCLFIGFAIIFQLGISLFKINIFKIIILAGTFSLAFAFAGNDLVNFVGVPLAAYDSWLHFSASGTDAQSFMMFGLLEPSQAPTSFLLLSGLVMIVTLWFSKKARRVIQTSINLSSSRSGEHEQFGSSLPGRMIVRAALSLGNAVDTILPNKFKQSLESRFKPKQLQKGETVLPFDYVRASVNLMVSAVLIASATSLKLPLSTTYVTFMVAMGSSFADGAWDRETAVYRVSGVLAVISGWFMTAFCACCLAALVAIVLVWGGSYAAILLGLGTFILLIRSNLRSSKQEMSLAKATAIRYDVAGVRDMINELTKPNFVKTIKIYSEIVQSFLNDNEHGLSVCKKQTHALLDELNVSRSLYYSMAHTEYHASKIDYDARYSYYRACNNMREIGKSLLSIANLAKEHVANRHRVYTGQLKHDMLETLDILQKVTTHDDCEQIVFAMNLAEEKVEQLQLTFLKMLPEEDVSIRGSELYLNYLFFVREVLSRYRIVFHLQKRINLLPITSTVVKQTQQQSEQSNNPQVNAAIVNQ